MLDNLTLMEMNVKGGYAFKALTWSGCGKYLMTGKSLKRVW